MKTNNQIEKLKKKALQSNPGHKQSHREESTKIKPDESDQRFAAVKYDPRFMKPTKQVAKVKIDRRFQKMLTDDEFKVVSHVDKYGRNVKQPEENQELKEFFYMDKEQDVSEQQEQEEAKPQKRQDSKKQKKIAKQKKQQVEEQDQDELQGQQIEVEDTKQDLRKWMEQYDQESSDTGDELLIEQALGQERQLWQKDQDNVVKGTDVPATKRLALCNYDWMNVKAQDIMLIFSSFKSKNGVILKVTVYPSEIGLQKLKQEGEVGPQGIWKDSDKAHKKPINQVKQKKSTHNKSSASQRIQNIFSSTQKKQETDLDPIKLREYQKQRLKYFYAVIECDSAKTAEEIYTLCDGNELENLGDIDLRFVPDEIVFPYAPHEVCTQVPNKSSVNTGINRAVGHSKVNLTWEDPEMNQVASLKKHNWGKLTEEELQKIDWSLYINNDDLSDDQEKQNHLEQQQSDSDEAQQKTKDFKDLFKKGKQRGAGAESEQMNIVFSSGFDVAQAIKDKKRQAGKSKFDKYMEQKKAKKAEYLQAKQQKREQLREERRTERPVVDRQKQRQKLELLVNNQGQKKNFQVNIADDRFSALYSKNSAFAIDPTSQHFKVNKTGEIFKEIVRRNKNKSQ